VALGDHSQFCERKVVELNRSGALTSCAFTETVKEWGAHTDLALFARISVCTIKDPQTNVYLSPQPRANKQIEVEKHIKHLKGEGYLKYSDKCSDKRKRWHWMGLKSVEMLV